VLFVCVTLTGSNEIGLNGWTPAEQASWVAKPSVEEFPQCIGIVDGWYLQINRPMLQPGKYYSQYKKHHAILFLIIIDRVGRIRLMSDAIAAGNQSETSCLSAWPINLHPKVRLVIDV
jgi:hypothetical protein